MTIAEERDALLARGDELWARLTAALDASLDRPLGPSTDWTGHDVYTHFARWVALSAENTQHLIDGVALREVPGTDDEVNERWRIEDQATPNEAAKRSCDEARRELQALVRSLSDDQWHTFGRACAQDVTAAHLEPHLRMIGS